MTQKPSFEPIIKECHYFDVSLPNGSHYHAEDKEDAQRIAKEISDKAKKEWQEDNDKDRLTNEYGQFVVTQMNSLVEHLNKQLWRLARMKCFDKIEDAQNKEEIETTKAIRDMIKGIVAGTHRLNWHQGFRDEATSYSFDKNGDNDYAWQPLVRGDAK